MGITLIEKDNGYKNGFSEFIRNSPPTEKDWVKSLREDGIAEFSELGFPTTRDEDWRFTNVTPIARAAFEISKNGYSEPSADDLAGFMFEGKTAGTLVFVNGNYAPGLSNIENLPEDVIISNLARALADHEEIVREHLAKYADIKGQAFTALNNAFFEDGGFVYIPSGTVLDAPVHLLYVSTPTETPRITNPRNLIVSGDNAKADVVEQYVSLEQSVYLSNVVTEIVVGENSTLGHYLIECESKKSFNISTLRVQQARNSNIHSHSVLLGGAIVRNNVHPVLAGEGCDSLISGLFMPGGRQHMDNYMKVEHASPHSDSRQFYNGILDGHSRGVFHGRIVVHEDAQKTDAKQTNRNLLLSDHAQIDTKPQLEIYADDVKCTHGATIGQIEEDAIFYLQSRGISKEAAQDIILNAFTNETLDSITLEPVKDYCSALVADWFNQRKSAE